MDNYTSLKQGYVAKGPDGMGVTAEELIRKIRSLESDRRNDGMKVLQQVEVLKSVHSGLFYPEHFHSAIAVIEEVMGETQ